MPQDRLYHSMLLDYYGELLTPRQRECCELYYHDDLSLSEIAEDCGISRQGAWDNIRRATATLEKTEEKTVKAAPVAPKAEEKPAKQPEAPKAAKPAKKPVTFTVHAERGKDVYVAGEFNKWDPTAKKMAYKARSGVYAAKINLAPGTYQYKFVIDGTWCADPANANAVPNTQGTFNSVITVK